MKNLALSLCLLLGGCALGYTNSTVKNDGKGNIYAESTTRGVGVVNPAGPSEVAAANLPMTGAAIQQQWSQAAIEQYRKTGMLPYYAFGYGTPGMIVGGQMYSASGQMLGGAPIGGIIGTYTPAGINRTNELTGALSPATPTYQIIQGTPGETSSTSDATPPPPPPPGMGDGSGIAPPLPNPAPPAPAPISCLTDETSTKLTEVGQDISDLLDARSFNQTRAREVIMKFDNLLRQATQQCRSNTAALEQFDELRDKVQQLRQKLRNAGPMAPAARSVPAVPGCDPRTQTCTP